LKLLNNIPESYPAQWADSVSGKAFPRAGAIAPSPVTLSCGDTPQRAENRAGADDALYQAGRAAFSRYLENQLPFGGVNQCGTGSYHAYFGFKAFSHERAVYMHV
jgi:hypothetical protein